jgi:hypothetical protein
MIMARLFVNELIDDMEYLRSQTVCKSLTQTISDSGILYNRTTVLEPALEKFITTPYRVVLDNACDTLIAATRACKIKVTSSVC